MVRALDSAVPIQLTKSTAPISHVFWSPDSTLIYYTTRGGVGELLGISPSGGLARRIMDRLAQRRQSRPTARRSPSGAPPNPAGQLKSTVWISSPPGAEPRRYQPAPFEVPLGLPDNVLRFSPDGNSILLIADARDSASLAAAVSRVQGRPATPLRRHGIQLHAARQLDAGQSPRGDLVCHRRRTAGALAGRSAARETAQTDGQHIGRGRSFPVSGRRAPGVHFDRRRLRPDGTAAGWLAAAHPARHQPQHVLALLVAGRRSTALRHRSQGRRGDMDPQRKGGNRPAAGHAARFSSGNYHGSGNARVFARRQTLRFRPLRHRCAAHHLGGTRRGRPDDPPDRRVHRRAGVVARRKLHRRPDAARAALAARHRRSGRGHVAARHTGKRDLPDAAGMVARRRVARLRGARRHPALFARRLQAAHASQS